MNKNRKYLDLHLHLDGAITPEIAEKLAEMQKISLPVRSREELTGLLQVPADCADLNGFLACFALPVSLMQTFEGLREAARLVCLNLRKQNVIYAELRFAPQLHTSRGMTQEEAVRAVLAGVGESGLHANLLLCCMRGNGNEKENEETLSLARRMLTADGGVVGLDLAGAEALFPTGNYRELFLKARDCGIPFTLHAGEADGAESVRLALSYGARRIGHGVRACEDPAVLQELLSRGIFLEMCPTSNRQTRAVADMSRYPFMDYLRQGIRVTLNTDDPAIEGTDIAREYAYMEKDFGLTEALEKTLLANAVDAAFTTEEVKKSLRRALDL